MEGNIVFYIYDKFIELNGRHFSAGELTADFLNLSPEVYRPMHERMARICQLEESFSKSRDLAQWWELNNEMETLCNELRRHTVFKLLLGEDEDRFFSVVREITGQFNLFPMVEEGAPSEEELKAIRSAAEKFFMLNEVDPTPEQDIPGNPLTCSIPVQLTKRSATTFSTRYTAPSARPKARGNDTESMSLATAPTSTISVPLTALFGISLSSVCPN